MKEIKIKVEENLDLYISDILCWLRGYLEAKGDDFPIGFPIKETELKPRIKRMGCITPSEEELADNPRARSAVLRIAEKL